MSVKDFTFPSLLHGALALLLACASAAAYGQANSIEAVDVSPSTGGRVIVKVTLKQALVAPPAAFSVTNPPRIAFDFMNTANALGRNAQEVGEGDLRSINVVQAGDRTRLVLNLARASGYDTQIDGRTLLITLRGRPRPPARQGSPPISRRRAPATPAMRCATSTSGADRPEKAAWSWTCRTAPSASISSSRAGPSSSTSSIRCCLRTCAGAWT
jgi:hypothetical protein